MQISVYSIQCLKNSENSIFPIVKMAANYAKIDRVSISGLDAGFHLFKVSEIFTILLWNINNLKSVNKSKK